MPYRLNSSGQIECDTASEAVALLAANNGNGHERVLAMPRSKRMIGGDAIAKSWAAAKKRAKAEGITPVAARSLIAKEKKAKAK